MRNNNALKRMKRLESYDAVFNDRAGEIRISQTFLRYLRQIRLIKENQ